MRRPERIIPIQIKRLTPTRRKKGRKFSLIEHNAEHQVAAGEPFGMDALMDAAGRLCVVQLLTGGQGFRLPGGASDRDFPGLDRIASEGTDKLRYAVRTKLFHMPSEGHVAPIHRQVAEFLAARYLAGLIRDGLPLRRVLSLMTGYDGVIVSELRGLSAWFTAHSKPSRAELVPRDPLGVVLYGDVRDFSVDEKVSLLDHLSRESKKNPWSLMKVGMDVRCGEIATQDMAGAILKHLQDPMRDEAPQSFIAIVIEMLCYGDPLPGIAKSLLDVARDDSRWPRIRCAAIDAFVQQRGDGGKARSELKDLLADVYSEKVRDTADDLLGQLLGELYPGVLSAPEILKYLRVPRKPDDCVKYEYFWAYLVPSRSTAEQLAELLDGLVEGYNELKVRLNFMPQSDLFLERLPILLLNVFLKKANEEIDCNRLFDWLGVARWVGDRESGIGTAAGARRVASWLQQRPGLWKTLWEKGLRRCIDRGKCADTEEFRTCMVMEQRRVLLDIASPRDLVRWHLDQALATDDLRAREWLMDYVAGCVYEPFRDAGISLAAAKERLAKRPALKAMFEARLNQHKENHARFNNASRQRQDRHQAERRRSQQKQRETIKSHEKALRGNQASPQILHFLAQAYLGGFRNVRGDCPRERLCVLVGDDDDLVEAVLDGLRGSIDRGDIPSDDEVIKLNCKSKRHILALPIVAGLEERASASPDCALRLSDKQIRLALAVHYTEPHWSAYIGGGRLAEQKSLWFPPLLKSHPSAVAEVLIKYARAKLQGRAESVDGLYELAHSQDHREVANMAALPLLKAFPARCNEARLQDLRHLLHSAALNRSGGDALADLIERKLANRSMNVGQRVYWLGAGLLVAPDKYVDKLDAYVAGRGRRIGNLERFLVALFDMPPGSFQLLSVSALKLLVRRVGATCKPAPASWESTFGEGGIIRQRMDAGLRVRAFIHRLASIPCEAAAIAFEELLSDDSLQAWRLEILDAADGQKKTRREGDFRHCSLEQALATLGNQGPANSADLAASTTDYLFEIARNIRDGNASDWRQYWNVDSHNRPQDARPEDACRDTLLSDLRERLLRQGIDAQPEGRYADDTRADIRVSYGGFNVPVETKRSCSRDLWSAIENQLIAKYARDPGADGYGIYLVFWFGNMEHCRPTPGTAGAPRSAAKLEQRLQGSLSEEVRRKISVCVIDVAAPGT